MTTKTEKPQHSPLTLVLKRGRFRAVNPADPEEPITLTSPNKERAATYWAPDEVENALYLTEHPAAILAAAFHGATPRGAELTGVFNADELRAALKLAQGDR